MGDEQEYRGRYHANRGHDTHAMHTHQGHRDRGRDRGRHHNDHEHGHQTIGPPENDRYPMNRHHVDGDEQYIVEMITKDELKRKVDENLQEMRQYAGSYASNLYQAQEMEQHTMDDIVNEMQHESLENGH